MRSGVALAAGLVGTAALAWAAYTALAPANTPIPAFVLSPPSGLVSWMPALPSGSIRLSASQEQMKSLIFSIARQKAEARFGANWIPFAQGLVANAYGESKLDPKAVGDSGYARGLFQLNYARATALGAQALKYYTKDQLFDPTINASFFIDTCLRTPQVTSAIMTGSAAACTEAITRYVEQPKDKDGESERRKRYVSALFGATYGAWVA